MRNKIPHLGTTLLCIGVYLVYLVLSGYPSDSHICKGVLFIRELLSLPNPDVLPCKSLFYRRVIVI